MKNLIVLSLFFVSSCAYSQGLLNNFQYDKDDLNIIFDEIGFHTFKYPIKQDVNQICDFVIEQYHDGKLVSEKSIVQVTREKYEKFGLDWEKYFNPTTDSIYLHRFYFIKKDSTLSLRIKTHGSTSVETFNSIGNSLFDVRTLDNINSEIEKNKYITLESSSDLIFLYSNLNKNKTEPLWCPSGLPKNEVIKRFKYVLYITLKKYSNHN